MSAMLQVVLIAAAAGVLVALLGYLVWLLAHLKRQQRRRAEVQARLDASNQEQHEQRRKSMELICLAALDGDCDLSEACIRVKHLLEYYPGLAAEPGYRAIFEMYEAVRGFDTHDARRALSEAERDAQDRARYQVEERYGNALMESFRLLYERMRALEGSRFDFDVGR